MGLITLITDYGKSDYYVALLHAAIYRYDAQSKIVDINHNVHRHDIMEASFFLQSVHDLFPLDTVHIVAVNAFYAPVSQLIFFRQQGRHYIGPNNGIFSLLFPDLQAAQVHTLDDKIDIANQYDLLGYVANEMLAGKELSEIGPPVAHLDQKISLQPVITSDQIRASIVHIDHFGNVIINLGQDVFDKIRKGRDYAIYYKSMDPILALSNGYNGARIGDVCAFFNTVGLLEIAVNMGNAHELLNLNKNETIQINFF